MPAWREGEPRSRCGSFGEHAHRPLQRVVRHLCRSQQTVHLNLTLGSAWIRLRFCTQRHSGTGGSWCRAHALGKRLIESCGRNMRLACCMPCAVSISIARGCPSPDTLDGQRAPKSKACATFPLCKVQARLTFMLLLGHKTSVPPTRIYSTDPSAGSGLTSSGCQELAGSSFTQSSVVVQTAPPGASHGDVRSVRLLREGQSVLNL